MKIRLTRQSGQPTGRDEFFELDTLEELIILRDWYQTSITVLIPKESDRYLELEIVDD